MADRDALLEDLLEKSIVIELAVRNGSRVLDVPVTAASDTCVNALDENDKAVDYIIRTQDY
jgi:hypothetical protein